MKFGEQYKEALLREEYPQEWIQSSISYKKLKKCIKRVQTELLGLGLDRETMDALWQHIGSDATGSVGETHFDRMMQYSFSTDPDVKFVPKLTVALDPRDGSPMDAWLSPETKKVLRKIGRKRSSITSSHQGLFAEDTPRSSNEAIGSNGTSAGDSETASVSDTQEIETIEIPLTSDSEFFQILRKELTSLDNLQTHQQEEIESEIHHLSDDLQVLKDSNKKRSKEEIEAWREIFRLYNDAEVFLSSHESDAGARNASRAEKQLQAFTKSLTTQQARGLNLSKDATVALDRFMKINLTLLRLLKFQELNRLALSKIMKKFDKRTALHAQSNILQRYSERPFMSQNLARATCFTISNQLLKLIPQLDDYLCPVCFSISWKPVRLACKHVFCIRCLIVLQRGNKDECPLCREKVVLEATEDHLDKNLMKFLKQNFKAEVKEKQKANELAAGIDTFGETYTHTHRCAIM